MIPNSIRSGVYLRCQGCCEKCGTRSRLELHHLRYFDDFGNPIEGSETVGDLIALCRECHHAKHLGPAGDFIIDPVEAADQRNWFDYQTTKDD